MNRNTIYRRIVRSIPREWGNQTKCRGVSLNGLEARRERNCNWRYAFYWNGRHHLLQLGSANQVQRFRKIVKVWQQIVAGNAADLMATFISARLCETSFFGVLCGEKPTQAQLDHKKVHAERVQHDEEVRRKNIETATVWLQQFRYNVIPLHLITKDTDANAHH